MIASVPQSEKLERQVLGTLFGSKRDTQLIAFEALEAEDFHAPLRCEIFEMLATMARDGQPLDWALMLERFRPLKPDQTFKAIWDETEECKRWGHVPPHVFDGYCLQLRNLAACRMLQRAALEVAGEAANGVEDPTDFLGRASVRIAQALSRRDDGLKTVSMREVVDRVYRDLETRRDHAAIGGITTGLTKLDAGLNGYRPGKLYVIAGRPGMGKSMLAQHSIRAVAGAGRRVLLFSLEMAPAEMGERFLAAESGVSYSTLGSGDLSSEHFDALAPASQWLQGLPIEFGDSTTVRIDELRRVARVQHLRNPLGLVVVDYMQLLKAEVRRSGNRNEEVGEISRGLKLLSMELNIPVIAVAQLNRQSESRADKRPQLSDLRDSGSIEQDADVVLLLHREDYYQPKDKRTGRCEIIVAKQRGGATGAFEATFDGAHARFGDIRV